MITRKVANFDSFSQVCPYFTAQYDVNNYYCCMHPDQSEKSIDKTGVERGCCFCNSCPLGIVPDENDFENPNVDWGDISRDDLTGPDGEFDVDCCDYIMVNVGHDATEEEKLAWSKYENYINRYNK